MAVDTLLWLKLSPPSGFIVFFAPTARSWSFFLSFVIEFFAIIPTLMNLISVASWLLRINKRPWRSRTGGFVTYNTILSLFPWVQFWVADLMITLVWLLIFGWRPTALLAVTRRWSLTWLFFFLCQNLFLYFHFLLGCYYFSQVSLLWWNLLLPVFHYGLHFVLSHSYLL